jgi:phage terminase large subunit
MQLQQVNNTNDRIVADSAEPKSIAELRKHGINVVPARKGRIASHTRAVVTAAELS